MNLNSLEDNYQFQHLKNQNKIHNIFFSYKKGKPMVLDNKILDEILEYLDKSINNLAKEAFENLELEGGFQGVNDFLQSQYDIRLENLLSAKKSSIHHLESSMKNKVIQRKQTVFENIISQHQN
jgi:hypothetical protein